MNVVFNLADVFTPESSTLENARVLKGLLDALVVADEAYLAHHRAPRLYASHVVYGRTNEWERIPDVLMRRSGDCKSLAAWRVAELRKDGIRADAVFRWKRRAKSGVPDFHIVVQRDAYKGPDGKITIWEDPSKVLGMTMNENVYMSGGR
jgi:hypothetical protein